MTEYQIVSILKEAEAEVAATCVVNVNMAWIIQSFINDGKNTAVGSLRQQTFKRVGSRKS
jgi:hypothetical protein